MTIYYLPHERSWSESLQEIFIPQAGILHIKAAFDETTWRGRVIHIILAALKSLPFIGIIIDIFHRCLANLSQPALQDKSKPIKGTDEILPDEEEILPSDETDKTIPSFKKVEPIAKLKFSEAQKEATKKILTTTGFEKEANDRPSTHGFKGEVQGTQALRFATANATKENPHAISLAALKEQRDLNIEQYLTLKLKRFGHTQSMSGFVTLPSGKQVNLEGFCEAFTVPMIASSFDEFARKTAHLTPDDRAWIVDHLNATTTSDFTEPEDIQALALMIQDPQFIGPYALGTGHHWHSTATIFFGNYLIFCNRGAGDFEHGIHIYYIPDKSLITEAVIWEMTKRQEMAGGDAFGNERIVKDLKGQLVYYHWMSAQPVGNCTYISIETALLVFMAIKHLMNLFGDEADALKALELFKEEDWREVFKFIEPIYKSWCEQDRSHVFQDMMEEIKEWKDKATPFGNYPLGKTYSELLGHHHNIRYTEKNSSSLLNQLLSDFGIT